MSTLRRLFTLLFLASIPCGAAAQDVEGLDLLIRGARVLDGTGNPWFAADVGVRDGTIVAVGDLEGAGAALVVDATGLVLAPGFVDIHSHGGDESGLLSSEERRRAAPNLVTQGITTVVVNPDGRGPLDIAAQRASYEARGIGPNAILLVGHNTVRGAVLGDDYRRPSTRAEVRQMQARVREGMEAGAWGLSAGLEYVPGRWSTTDELVALAEVVAEYGGFYIAHERSESVAPMWWKPSRHEPGPPTLLDAVQETIEIGERTGITVVASHLKARGAMYWGSGRAAISLIDRARERGVRVFGDAYPYDTSGSDGSTVLVPGWAIGYGQWDETGDEAADPDYAARLDDTLADSGRAAAVRRDVRHEMQFRGGPEKIVVFEHPDEAYVGRSLAELARERGVPPVEMALALQREGFRDRPGGARLRSFSFSEIDIEMYAAQPWLATASDGGVALPEDGPRIHPRYYGTFTRKLRRYAIERGVLSVPDAIRAATTLPAQILGLRDRGQVREGFRADLVLLDLERVRDRATFTEPHQHSEGVVRVWVGGEAVVEGEEPTWALPGTVITPETGRRPPSTLDH